MESENKQQIDQLSESDNEHDNNNEKGNQKQSENEIENKEDNNQNEQKGEEGQKLSKKQLKKQQKKIKWQQIKQQKRKQQKLKQKLKKQQKRLNQPEQIRQAKQPSQSQPQTKRRKDEYMQKMADGLKVIIDLQFYDLMTQKQQNSLAKQLSYCHSVNRNSKKSFNYILTSATPKHTQMMYKKFHIQNFGITILEPSLLECFAREKLVYLTGDATQQIQQFSQNDIYIIGGIVDHNRLKRLTINYAQQNKIRARRLPMDGVRLKASVHLAVNHVWEWMLRVYNGSTWRGAIEAVVPLRKRQEGEKDQGEAGNQVQAEEKQEENIGQKDKEDKEKIQEQPAKN